MILLLQLRTGVFIILHENTYTVQERLLLYSYVSKHIDIHIRLRKFK